MENSIKKMTSFVARALRQLTPGTPTEPSSEIDLTRARGFWSFMFRNDDLYLRNVASEDRNIRPDSIVRLKHPFANIPTNKLASSGGVTHEMLRNLWAANRSVDVLDIGAYVGDFSLDLASFSRDSGKKMRVTMYEPGATCELAQRNIEINKFENVNLVTHAVSDHEGTEEFVILQGNLNASRLKSGDWNDSGNREGTKTHTVIVDDILEVLTKFEPSDLLLIKIDTEGQEKQIITRILGHKEFARRTMVVFEYTPDQYTLNERIEFITTLCIFYKFKNIKHYRKSVNNPFLNESDIEKFCEEPLDGQYGYADILLVPKEIHAYLNEPKIGPL